MTCWTYVDHSPLSFVRLTFRHLLQGLDVRGANGASVDPAGPVRRGNNLGDADPWTETWFYANPVFIDVA
ncbi:hypothetical protein AB4Y77_17235 [Paenarthrobacter sp. YAF11_1]|uniref:hypothetical protein n=1 Tax=Paenarthrobacter sp. YAF11_1 TaxID=3233074 RepID=UPI003F982F13